MRGRQHLPPQPHQERVQGVRQTSKCKECGGSAICEHNRHRYECRVCAGAGICHHNRRKNKCKECAGRRYASIIVKGTRARYARVPASVTTSVQRAIARSVAGRRHARITAKGTSARYAGAPPQPYSVQLQGVQIK